ncbi:MAG: BrnA antitoxin family protein [Nitrospinae bacterium]|nr:BrnA antitoxin family protein [Nitrospinota bacterium]
MKKQSKPKKTVRVNPEWTAAMIAKARPAKKVLPEIFGARTAAAMLKPRGRAKSSDSKIAISLRLPPDTLARWKATGPGWQTRMADILRESL